MPLYQCNWEVYSRLYSLRCIYEQVCHINLLYPFKQQKRVKLNNLTISVVRHHTKINVKGTHILCKWYLFWFKIWLVGCNAHALASYRGNHQLCWCLKKRSKTDSDIKSKIALSYITNANQTIEYLHYLAHTSDMHAWSLQETRNLHLHEILMTTSKYSPVTY